MFSFHDFETYDKKCCSNKGSLLPWSGIFRKIQNVCGSVEHLRAASKSPTAAPTPVFCHRPDRIPFKALRHINPRAPVAQKNADEVVLRTFSRWRSRVFQNRTSLTPPPQIFDAHLLESTDLSPFRFHFSVGFISWSYLESDGFLAYSKEWDWREKTMFIQTNQPLFTSFYIKKGTYFLPI